MWYPVLLVDRYRRRDLVAVHPDLHIPLFKRQAYKITETILRTVYKIKQLNNSAVKQFSEI